MRILPGLAAGIAWCALAMKLGVWTAQAQTPWNLLVNPGFEDPLQSPPPGNPPVGWGAFAGAVRTDMSESPFDYPHGGDYALLAQNAPGNNWNPVGVSQIVPGAVPGGVYEFSCWYLTDTGFTGGAPEIGLQISYLDSSQNQIGSPAGDYIYGVPSNDTWYQGYVIATAPVGAAYIQVNAWFLDNGQTSFENVYFDDAAIPLIPEPAGPALAILALAMPVCLAIRRRAGV